MATWKSENSFLTSVGEEILNKLKVGQGAITITRIVAGSGRVATSQINKQTSISGVQKEFTLNGIKTYDQGSELSFFITNENFTESYVINQIGVYVTHPDYVGEQLYHISQCEEGSPDVVPPYADNAVTMGYSLFLAHGNSSSIVVNVDPSGMVSIGEFNTFKTEISNKLDSMNGSLNALKTATTFATAILVE